MKTLLEILIAIAAFLGLTIASITIASVIVEYIFRLLF